MFPLKTLLVACALTLSSSLPAAEGEEVLGSLYQCAHGLRGVVIAKNDREILIKGFNYDGKGPSAWFHAQRKGAKGVYTSDGDYVTLPYPGDSCDRLKPGRSYADEDVTVILPESITNFETIGVYCYEYCHNFGHIVINSTLSVPAAPSSLQVVNGCPPPKYRQCSLDSSKNSQIRPNCKAGASHMSPMMTPAGSTAAILYSCVGTIITSFFAVRHMTSL